MNRTSTGPRIALATCAAFPRLAPDDQLLVEALAARGARPLAVVWDDEEVDWSGFDACVVRSVWDYHFKHERFLVWARRAGAAIPLWNGPELLAWNSEKTYLLALDERGVPTIPTAWPPGARPRTWPSCWPRGAGRRRWSSRPSTSGR